MTSESIATLKSKAGHKEHKARSQSWLMARNVLRNPSGLLGAFLLILLLFLAVFGPILVTHDPTSPSFANRLDTPNTTNWLGTDELGRDILARLVNGARISLGIAITAVVIGVSIGATLGMIAGFKLGLWEMIIMRGIDVLLALPGFLLALLAIAVLGRGATNLVIAISIYSVPVFARIAHATTLSVRGTEFVEAARAIGASDSRILFRQVAPNIVSPLLVQATIRLATALLLAASLSFLGLGVQPPQPEWGAMLAGGRAYINAGPHVILFPGLAIMLATLSFNLLGDALRDAIDPRYRRG